MTPRPNEAAEIRPELHNGIELLDRVAHELRGPAGVTLGALEEIEQALGEQAGEHAALLEMAQRGVRKILRTAERLTRLSRLEASTPTLMLAPTDLGALVRATAKDAVFIEGRRSIALETLVPEDSCIGVADATWLRVAVAELLSQAVRTARQKVTIELTRAGREVRVTVRDDGALGQRAALVPGARQGAEAPPSPSRADSTFSLELANRIAQLHSTALELRSIVPQGLEVALSLPAVS